nr:acetyl-CoA acetyltransferase [Paenibacillus alvei]
MSPIEVRRFVRRNVGRLVVVVLCSGEVLVGRIIFAGIFSFRLRIRRRGISIIRRIRYDDVRAIKRVFC